MDFNHLNGVDMEELHLLDTNINDRVDFGYITSWIYVELDESVRCVNSECSGELGGRTVSWDRLRNNCTGQDDCRDTCYCITRYAAGLEQFVDDGIEARMTLASFILVGIIACVVCIAIGHWQTGCLRKLRVFHSHDDFDFKSCLAFCLQ